MKQRSDPASESGCRTLVERAGSRIWCAEGLTKELSELNEQRRAQFLRFFQRWCESVPLKHDAFSGEERTARGVNMSAFKTWGYRLYGAEFRVEGVRTFVIVDSDPTKKRTKQKPHLIKRAMARVDGFVEENRL